MTTNSLYSKMYAFGMIVITHLDPLHPLELPTNMNYLLTSMTTHILRITPPHAPLVEFWGLPPLIPLLQ